MVEVLDSVKEVLGRLRRSLSAKAETAYGDRDAAGEDSEKESYASGEAHAYGAAADEVRDAENKADESGSAATN